MVGTNPKQIIWQLLGGYFNTVMGQMCHFPAEFNLSPWGYRHLCICMCCQVKSGPSQRAGNSARESEKGTQHLASCSVSLCSGYIEEACIIPCPSDCKLSEWSNWSRCSKSCGSGVKVRSKWLREKPYNGGRPCPKLDHVNQVFS